MMTEKMTQQLSIQVMDDNKNVGRISVQDKGWTGCGWEWECGGRGCWMSTKLWVEFFCVVNCGNHTMSSVFITTSRKCNHSAFPFQIYVDEVPLPFPGHILIAVATSVVLGGLIFVAFLFQLRNIHPLRAFRRYVRGTIRQSSNISIDS